jgi:hypothetical protein
MVMARSKGQTAKRISPANTPSENFKIAQLGEWWGEDEISQDNLLLAWLWRILLLLYDPPLAAMSPRDKVQMAKSKNKRAKDKADLLSEIGAALGSAIAKGDWKHLLSFAKAVQFVDERWDWHINSIDDIKQLGSGFYTRKFKPLSDGARLRMTIIREYFFTTSEGNDTARKTRSSFMAHIVKIMKRKGDSLGHGAFSKSFDRACESLGINWKHNKGKRRSK